MDPLTTILSALVAGAAAAAKPLAGEIVKDAYRAIRSFVQARYGKVSLAQLEESPESKPRRDVVAEDLVKAGADKDTELLRHAKALLEAIVASSAGSTNVFGLDLEKIKARSMTLQDIVSSDTAIKIKDSEFTGDILVTGVRAGVDPKKA